MDPHGYTSEFSRPHKLLVMRHPQTQGNVNGEMVGQSNGPLSETGKQQISAAAQAIATFKPERILSSPLQRCLAIAHQAGKLLEMSVDVDDELIEMNFGPLEGMPAWQVQEQGLCFPWDDPQGKWPLGDAESMEAFMERTAVCANKLAHLQGRTVAVTHGGVIRGLVSAWIGVPLECFWNIAIDNVCSVYVEFDQEGNAFLKGLGLTPQQVIAGWQ